MPKIVIRLTTPRMHFWQRAGGISVVYWRPMRQLVCMDGCPLCEEGVCAQRLEWGKGWEKRLRVHGHLPN